MIRLKTTCKTLVNILGIAIPNIFIFLMSASCNCDSKYYNPDVLKIIKKQDRSTLLVPKTIGTIDNGDILGLCNTDKYLIVITNTSGQFIRVYDMATDSLIASFGEFGNAANEFEDYISHYYVYNDPEGNALLYVTDCKGILTKVIDIEKSLECGGCVLRKTYKHPVELSGLESRNYYIDNDYIVYYKEVSFVDPRDNLFNPPTFGVLKSGTHTIQQIFPNIISNDCINVILGAYSIKSCISPRITHIVGVMKFIDIITIVDLSTLNTTGLIDDASYDFYFLENQVNRENLTSKLRLYNLDICAAKECFFVLKECGKTIDELSEKRRDSSSIKYLYAYSWDGEIIDSFMMSEELLRITYNDSSRRLYGADENGKLFKYDIPITTI